MKRHCSTTKRNSKIHDHWVFRRWLNWAKCDWDQVILVVWILLEVSWRDDKDQWVFVAKLNHLCWIFNRTFWRREIDLKVKAWGRAMKEGRRREKTQGGNWVKMTWRRTEVNRTRMKAKRRRGKVMKGRGRVITFGRRMKMIGRRVKEDLRGVKVRLIDGWRRQEIGRNEFKYSCVRNGQSWGWFRPRYNSSCLSSHYDAWTHCIGNLKRWTWYFDFAILTWGRTYWSIDSFSCFKTSLIVIELGSSFIKCFWIKSKSTCSPNR